MSSTNAPATDVIDRLLGLQPGEPVHALRHARAKVVDATQAFHELAFDSPETEPALRHDRLLAAAVLAQATGPDTLAQEYRRRLRESGASSAHLAALDDPQAGGSAPLAALVHYAQTLALNPGAADRAALLQLVDAGWSAAEVVALAQIMGYVSYQARMMIGLAALQNFNTDPSGGEDAADDASFVHPAHLPAPGERLDVNGYTNATLGWKSWLPIQDLTTLTEEQTKV